MKCFKKTLFFGLVSAMDLTPNDFPVAAEEYL